MISLYVSNATSKFWIRHYCTRPNKVVLLKHKLPFHLSSWISETFLRSNFTEKRIFVKLERLFHTALFHLIKGFLSVSCAKIRFVVLVIDPHSRFMLDKNVRRVRFVSAKTTRLKQRRNYFCLILFFNG